MGVSFPRGRLQWGLTGLLVVTVASVVVGAWCSCRSRDGSLRSPQGRIGGICDEERQLCEDTEQLWRGIVERHDEQCDEKIAGRDRTIEALEERVKPCCPDGCEKELAYREYLFQSQRNYFRKQLKDRCGVHHPPAPDDDELVDFSQQIEEEDEEEF